MALKIFFSNKTNVKHGKNESNTQFKTDPVDDFENPRDALKNTYGWVSPYEYYNGKEDASIKSEYDEEKKTSLDLTDEDDPNSGIEKADIDDPPDYFWVNSICNWCYYKTYRTNEKWTATTFAGKLWAGVKHYGRFLNPWKYIVDVYHVWTEGWEGGFWSCFVNVFENVAKMWGVIIADLALWAVSWVALLVSLPSTLLVCAISAAFDECRGLAATTSVGMLYIESVFPEGKECNMGYPLNGAELMMWDGYRRCWRSIIAYIETWAKYYYPDVRGSILYTYSMNNMFAYVMTFDDSSGDFVKTDKPGVLYNTEMRKTYQDNLYTLYTKDTAATIEVMMNQYVKDVNKILGRSETASLDTICEKAYEDKEVEKLNETFATNLSSLITNDYMYNKTSQEGDATAFRQMFGFDPRILHSFASPSDGYNQCVFISNNKNDQSWQQTNYHDMTVVWTRCEKDSPNEIIWDKDTFQYLTRPWDYQKHFERDCGGMKLLSCGCPMTYRGSDNILRLALWMRWSTNGRASDSGDWSEYEYKAITDIYDQDISRWSEILHKLFERHDDYKYEQWLSNYDAGLEFEGFTVEEEVAETISSIKEAALINNLEHLPTASEEECEDKTLTLTLNPADMNSEVYDWRSTLEKWN